MSGYRNHDDPAWAKAIRQRRLELEKSQEKVAEASAGLLYQTEISRIERGLVHPTKDLGLEKFFSLLEALQWSIEAFYEATGIRSSKEQQKALEAIRRLEVHPDWLTFPVLGSVAAGNDEARSERDDVAYVPREKLRAKGVDPKHVRVYLVNGDCMISDEARRFEKNIAPGDHIAVDTSQRPQAGDIVVAWWPEAEKMVVKRYKLEREGIVLYPANPSHPNLVLPSEDDIYIIGRVIWRGG